MSPIQNFLAPPQLKMSVADLLSAGGPAATIMDEHLATAVRSRWQALNVTGPESPLGQAIIKVKFPAIVSIEKLTLREVLERTVGSDINPEDPALALEYKRLTQRLTEFTPIREILRLDQSLGEHRLFRDFAQAVKITEVLRLTAFPASEKNITAFVTKLRAFPGASPEFWTAVANDGLVSTDLLPGLRSLLDLWSLTFQDLPLLRALVSAGFTTAEPLVGWNTAQWRQFLQKNALTSPGANADGDRLGEYALQLEARFAGRFPTSLFFRRLNPSRIEQQRDELYRAAVELTDAPAPEACEPSPPPPPPCEDDSPTVGSLLRGILRRLFGQHAKPEPADISAPIEPPVERPVPTSEAAGDVRKLFGGLGLEDILRDRELNTEAKVSRILQRVRKLDDFHRANPELDLLRTDFHRGIRVGSEASKERPLFKLTAKTMTGVQAGTVPATVRYALLTGAKINVSDGAQLTTIPGGWQLDDPTSAASYVLHRMGEEFEVFPGINWTAVGEDRPAIERQLKIYQRLLRLSPRFDDVERLLLAGYDSAWKIALAPDAAFLPAFAGDPQQGQGIRQRAYAASEHVTLTYLNARNAVGTGAFRDAFFENTSVDVTEFLRGIPGYPELFELPRFCDCAHCKSIFGPPAYLVDLMRFIAIEITDHNTIDPTRSLLSRRGDIWDIPLDCEQANQLIPYIDIVNEVLERRVQAETGTSPYEYLEATAFHPFSLPFHLPLTQTRAYLGHFKPRALFEMFEACGRPEAWVANEYLQLTARDATLLTTSSTAGGWLGRAYGVTNPSAFMPADVWGLIRVDNFLAHTGLSRRELSRLLFQNLDADERVVSTGLVAVNTISNRQADFYVNNVHDHPAGGSRLGSLAIEIDATNPNDQHEVLRNLTAAKLDRIHRFVRLARQLDWTFEDLDWVLRSIGKTGPADDIDADALIRLYKIKRWQDRFRVPLDELASLWFNLKTIGRKEADDFAPQDLFDRVYNNPRVLRGEPAYRPPVGGLVLLLRQFNRVDPTNAHRGWLLAALQLTNDELNQIAATFPANAVTLTLANLSYFYRLSRMARMVARPVRDLLAFLSIRGVAPTQSAINAHLQDFDALEETFGLLAWAKSENWSIATLQYLHSNEPNEEVDPGFHDDDVDALLEELSSHPLLPETAFTAWPESPALTAMQSQALFNELVAQGFIARAKPGDAFGRLTNTFTPTAVNFTLGLAAPYDDPLDERRVIELLGRYHNLTMTAAERRQQVLQGLASFFQVGPESVAALIELTDEPLNAARIASLTTTVARTDPAYAALVRFLRKVHARSVLAGRLKLSVEEIVGIAAQPGAFDLGGLATVPLVAVRNLQRYRALAEKWGDGDGRLLRFLVGLSADFGLLASVTGWDQSQIVAVTAALGNLPGLNGLQRLDRCFSLSALLRIDARLLLDFSDWNNKTWPQQQAVARAALEVFKAHYGDEAWVQPFEELENQVRERKRDALAAWLTWRYRPNGIRDREDLYQFLLIDVNMTSCEKISRIKEALNALQLYVHRCAMNLETDVAPESIPKKQWQWMKNYRVWEANRKAFLYPENYLEPELRDDKTTLYRELEDELLQGEVTADTVAAAYRNYLDKFSEIANLTIAGAYSHEESDVEPETGQARRTIHLIGRTRTSPRQFYQRQYINETRWTPWERIDLSIKSEFVSPVVAFERLFIFWVEVTRRQRGRIVTGNSQAQDDEYTSTVYYSFRTLNGRWVPPQTLRADIVIGRQRALTDERACPGFRYQDFQLGTRYVDRLSGVYLGDSRLSRELRENLVATEDSVGESVAPVNSTQYLTQSGGRLLEMPYSTGGLNQDALYWEFLLQQEQSALPNSGSRIVLNDNVSFDQARTQVVNNAFDLNVGRFTCTVFDNGDEQFLVRTVDNSAEVNAFWEWIKRTGLDPAGFPSPHKYSFERISTSVVLALNRELLVGGVDALLSLRSQHFTELPFSRFGADPALVVAPPADFDALDFDGPFGLYYREVFFHIPALIASRLNANHRFEDAQRWFHYVFDPTATEANPPLAHPHDRYWRYLPFRNQVLSSFQSALSDPAALEVYHENPFQPHAIARLRNGAYQKNVVMKYIDNLIDWAEEFFRQDTWESITEGTMLYVMAYHILGGTPPEQLDPCEEPPTQTYRGLAATWTATTSLPEFLIEIENVAGGSPRLLFSNFGGASRSGALSLEGAELDGLMSTTRNSASLLYFCFPENAQLRAYWQRVMDGLFKIRHCLDITGKRRQLALYEPPTDPAALVRAAAGGRDLGDILADLRRPLPHYRFAYLMEKARQFAAQVSQFGAALLSALEKKDAEQLMVLRSTHERAIQQLTLLVREKQRDAAVESHAGLIAGRVGAETRQRHYSGLLAQGLSRHEELHLKSMMTAWYLDHASQLMNLDASLAHLVPNTGSGLAMTYGGREIGASLRGVAEAFRLFASYHNQGGAMSSITGNYRRREQEWSLQNRLAGNDVEQINRQIAAAERQREIAEQEIAILARAQEQNEKMDVFLKDKFTARDLYQWMSGQLAGLYFQSYQLAVDLAKSAERAFQYEGNTNQAYIQFGHWDNLKNGLLVGERLTLELSQLEKAYLDGNARTFEIEKHISLAQLDPAQLFTLKTTGLCEFVLPEILFDSDFPGHYCRKIKTVALSIPAVVGPYQSVKATLTQLSNRTLLQPNAAACAYLLSGAGDPPADNILRADWRRREEIAISSANNDGGVFELNFRDERYLPFEGSGAVSSWRLTMPRQTNRLNFDTISDVILHLRYTALSDGNLQNAVVALLAAEPSRGFRMISVRQEFSAAWHRFVRPPAGATTHRLELPIAQALFPENVAITAITEVSLFLATPPGDSPFPLPTPLTIALQPGGARLTDPANLASSGPGDPFAFSAGPMQSLAVADFELALTGPWILEINRATIPTSLRRRNEEGTVDVESIGGQPHYFLDDVRLANLGLILAYEGEVGWDVTP